MARYVVDIGENVLVVEYCPVSDTVDDIKFDQVDAGELYVRVNGKFINLYSFAHDSVVKIAADQEFEIALEKKDMEAEARSDFKNER